MNSLSPLSPFPNFPDVKVRVESLELLMDVPNVVLYPNVHALWVPKPKLITPLKEAPKCVALSSVTGTSSKVKSQSKQVLEATAKQKRQSKVYRSSEEKDLHLDVLEILEGWVVKKDQELIEQVLAYKKTGKDLDWDKISDVVVTTKFNCRERWSLLKKVALKKDEAPEEDCDLQALQNRFGCMWDDLVDLAKSESKSSEKTSSPKQLRIEQTANKKPIEIIDLT